MESYNGYDGVESDIIRMDLLDAGADSGRESISGGGDADSDF